jgi:hypothetical protein
MAYKSVALQKAANRKKQAYKYGKSLMYFRRTRRISNLIAFNPQPVFTETFKLSSALLPNAGFLLAPNIDSIAQVAQYSALYQKYRILKAAYLLVPNFTGGTDQNVAIFNTVSGNFPSLPGVSTAGTARIVYVADNSPNQAAPVSEDATLQENGCRIKMAGNLVRMSTRPVPDIKDANNNLITLKQKYLNFNSGTPNIAHYGIRGWIYHPYSVGTGTFNIADSLTFTVYCKLTFQVAEPR